MKFVLASKSPRRVELLKLVGLEFTVQPSDIDENLPENLSPEDLVMQLATLKASHIASTTKDSEVYIIGADTIVVHKGDILGKPIDEDDAVSMLKKLSGDSHDVYTGYTVVRMSDAFMCTQFEKTTVHFKPLTEEEILRYVKTGEPMDKAGAYGIQQKGSLIVDRIDGDYFNVVGLPVCALAQMLRKEFGIDLL